MFDLKGGQLVLERADRWHLAKMAPGFLCLAMQIHLKFELLAPHEHNLKEELVSLKKKKTNYETVPCVLGCSNDRGKTNQNDRMENIK